MMLMCSEKRQAKLFLLPLIAVLLLTGGLFAQSKKASSKKPEVKKGKTVAKDAAKDKGKNSNSRAANTRNKTTAKETRNNRNDKVTARSRNDRDDRNARNLKNDDKRGKNSRDKDDDKRGKNSRDKDKASNRNVKDDNKSSKNDKKAMRAEARRIEEQRRREAEERRQAIIAEQQRRAREARERQIAFERGLHDETTSNILNDNTEGEDLSVRRAAVDALGSHAGTVVVMEAQTGKVLTIVNQDWGIRNGFKPCSTIKLVTGVAGVSENVINDEGGIGESTSGMDLDNAIAHSNNGYFQRVGSNVGSTKMVDYARALGLGAPTGLNRPGETAGRVPNGNRNPRIYSHGDDFEVTPLQLAVLVSAIANNGQKVIPQVAPDPNTRVAFRPRFGRRVELPTRSFQHLLPGMMGTAEYGTARKGVDASQGIAGKTGSCIAKGSWVGLFASVAPVEQPKYAVVVITRGEGERGKYAAAVAGKIYRSLRPMIRRDPERLLAIQSLQHHDKIDRRGNSVDEDDDDADTPDSSVVASNPESQRRMPDQPIAAKKVVTRTVQSKPVFKPVVIEYDRSGELKSRPRIVKNK